MYKLKDEISFTYKGGRYVEGIVTGVFETAITIDLYTDYLGRNVDWFAGENKAFNINEMTNVTHL